MAKYLIGCASSALSKGAHVLGSRHTSEQTCPRQAPNGSESRLAMAMDFLLRRRTKLTVGICPIPPPTETTRAVSTRLRDGSSMPPRM
jgi:hypothetical protein